MMNSTCKLVHLVDFITKILSNKKFGLKVALVCLWGEALFTHTHRKMLLDGFRLIPLQTQTLMLNR